MNLFLFDQLHADGVIGDGSLEKIKLRSAEKNFSLHWEIKTILYLGVLLLTGGLGILVYKNIDTIGHQAILLFIALVSTGSFFYCFKNKLPFSTGKVASPNSFFDYLLLLACLTFVIFIAYLQYEYNVFGNRYGLATFMPMLVLFFAAYYFDQLGILSLAITNFAAWLGITVTPLKILQSNDFNSSTIIFTGLFLGILLISIAWFTKRRDIKKHFEFIYNNFGTHIVLISCLAAMFHFNRLYLVWFLLLLGIVYYFYRKAIADKSFYFLMIITLYAYIGISHVVIDLLEKFGGFDMGAIYLGLLYFIGSGIGLVVFLMRSNKKIKTS